MYPNLYYIFKDWFGVHWETLKLFNSFGLMVALAFLVAAWVLSSELRRKERLGLLLPREENVVVGKPASAAELAFNFFIGFLFGYKLVGLIFSRPENMNPQQYIFSSEGNILGGIVVGLILLGLKYWEKNKQKLKKPESRKLRIWPHDRVGDIIILGLIFGIIGAKLFDNLEHWDQFIQDPIAAIFSASGLAFYGGLILAAIAICWFAYKKGISIKHLVDSAAPALMIAYAIGRLGCQVSGDGDWGIYNSAYTSDAFGNLSLAKPGDFENNLEKYKTYYISGQLIDSNNVIQNITDRTYGSLDNVPHKSFAGPSFLPKWLFAYSYPQNVNADGILIPGNTEEHNRVLPSPVFPTPLFEIVVCSLFFLIMWGLRKKITTPLVMFGLYLTLNGIERFFIETIRVNKRYDVFGMQLSQAEIIAIILTISGIALIFTARKIAKAK